jgi:hypothetical protein
MPEERDALRPHYRQLGEDLLSAIRGLSDESMIDPSLAGWSVKDHLAHLALWDGSAARSSSVWADPAVQVLAGRVEAASCVRSGCHGARACPRAGLAPIV